MTTDFQGRPLRRPKVRPLGVLTSLGDKTKGLERVWFRQEVSTVRDFIQSRAHRLGTAKSRFLTHPLSRDRAMSAVSRKLCWAGQNSGRVNNASVAQLYNPVPDRVVNADVRDGDILNHVLPVCARHAGRRTRQCSNIRAMQCEVLGPYFCSDCIRVRKEEQFGHESAALYPDLDVHPRCLVAPFRVERFNASLSPAYFPDYRRFECGCELSVSPDLSNPLVFTGNDVHGRVRRSNRMVLDLQSKLPLMRVGSATSRPPSSVCSLSPTRNPTPDLSGSGYWRPADTQVMKVQADAGHELHDDDDEEEDDEEEEPRHEDMKVTVRFQSSTSQRVVPLS